MLNLLALSTLFTYSFAQYSATYLPSNVPAQTEQGQFGTNQCGTGSNETSICQNAYINSVDDFCLFAPPEPGANSLISDTEQIEVAWCMKSGYGTRLIPDGTIQGAHFVQTPDYVQITGVGDLTKLNIPAGNDGGGELDPHGATGNGNPIGGLVFSSAFGQLQQLHEWTNFMSNSEFCFRACKEGSNARRLCQHIYDVMGCFWNMPGDYSSGVFEKCEGDTGEPMGVYGTSTFFQGQPVTPDAHPAPATSQCTSLSTISNGVAAAATTTAPGSTTVSATTTTAVSSTISSSISTVASTTVTSLVSSVETSGVTTTSSSATTTSSGFFTNSSSPATTTSTTSSANRNIDTALSHSLILTFAGVCSAFCALMGGITLL